MTPPPENELAAERCFENLRHATQLVVAASLIIAAAIVVGSGVAVNPDGVGAVAFVIGAVLVVTTICSVRPRLVRLGDCLGALGLMWLGGLASGVIAVMGLRGHMPLADGVLLRMDRVFGVDGLAIVAWLAAQPDWLIALLGASYFYTIPVLYLSFVLLALLGDRVEVWRAAFCFVGTVLTTCLVSILFPAKGLGMWASPELIARLPAHSIRHFWPAFDNFYTGAHPVLQLGSLGGVVSFPSFHTIMGLIAASMWRQRPLIFVPAAVGCAVMLVATLPFGGHYTVDLAAGGAVWGAWFVASRRVERWNPQATASAVSSSGGEILAAGGSFELPPPELQ